MNAIKHSSRSCSVDLEGNELWAKSTLISTDYEAYIHLKVNLNNLILKYVHWEVYRSPFDNSARGGEITELIGLNVFSYSAKKAFQLLDSDLREIILELLSEGIRGVIQTSSFVGKVLGNSSYRERLTKQVIDYLVNSCAFYSLPNGSDSARKLMEERSLYPRISFFHRHKSYHIFLNPDRSLFSTTCFADIEHEILLNISCSKDGKVTDISGSFLRSPRQVCCETIELLNNLKGKTLSNMRKKEIAEFVGGASGCNHLLEICYDLGMELADL